MTGQDVIDYYKGAPKAAKALNVTRQSVYDWRKFGISYERQCAIQIATRGRLKADKAHERVENNS